MKGISTILAMILIVIIVVALIGLTYTFAVNLFSTTSGAASDETTALSDRMQKSVDVLAVTCVASTKAVTFTLKNTGLKSINTSSELSAFLANTQLTSLTIAPQILTAGSVTTTGTGTATSATLVAGTQYTLKISAPAADAIEQVTCT